MKKQTTMKIDLGLSDITIQSMSIDDNGEYHVMASCTSTHAICTKCKQRISRRHGSCNESIVEHLPILDNRVFIHVRWPRFMCLACDKTSSFHPEWLNDTGKLTRAYENFFSNF